MPHSHPKKMSTLHKVNTWTSREISNSDVISFVIKNNIVNLPIPKWRDIDSEEQCTRKIRCQPPNCWCVVVLFWRWKVISPSCHHWVIGQQLALDGLTRLWQLTIDTWELLELKDWKLNKLYMLFLHKWSKQNPFF